MLFGILDELGIPIRLERLVTDFESSLLNLTTSCPHFARRNVQHGFCFFHYGQCIYGQVSEKGFRSDYLNDVGFRIHVKMLIAMGLVPTTRKQEFLDALKADCMYAYAQVRDYCELNVFTFAFSGDPRMDVLFTYFDDNWMPMNAQVHTQAEKFHNNKKSRKNLKTQKMSKKSKIKKHQKLLKVKTNYYWSA